MAVFSLDPIYSLVILAVLIFVTNASQSQPLTTNSIVHFLNGETVLLNTLWAVWTKHLIVLAENGQFVCFTTAAVYVWAAPKSTWVCPDQQSFTVLFLNLLTFLTSHPPLYRNSFILRQANFKACDYIVHNTVLCDYMSAEAQCTCILQGGGCWYCGLHDSWCHFSVASGSLLWLCPWHTLGIVPYATIWSGWFTSNSYRIHKSYLLSTSVSELFSTWSLSYLATTPSVVRITNLATVSLFLEVWLGLLHLVIVGLPCYFGWLVIASVLDFDYYCVSAM